VTPDPQAHQAQAGQGAQGISDRRTGMRSSGRPSRCCPSSSDPRRSFSTSVSQALMARAFRTPSCCSCPTTPTRSIGLLRRGHGDRWTGDSSAWSSCAWVRPCHGGGNGPTPRFRVDSAGPVGVGLDDEAVIMNPLWCLKPSPLRSESASFPLGVLGLP